MDETPHPTQNTASGRPHGTPDTHLRLPDLPDYKLGVEGDLNSFDASDSEFLKFVQDLVPLTGENLEHWTWEERRDFLNWCLDERVLTIQEGRLVPVEETIPTAPPTNDQRGVTPEGAEDAEVAHDGERDSAGIIADLTTNADELSDEPALHTTSDARPMHEQQSREEGSSDAL